MAFKKKEAPLGVAGASLAAAGISGLSNILATIIASGAQKTPKAPGFQFSGSKPLQWGSYQSSAYDPGPSRWSLADSSTNVGLGGSRLTAAQRLYEKYQQMPGISMGTVAS